jgi:predicted transcriptional regulator
MARYQGRGLRLARRTALTVSGIEFIFRRSSAIYCIAFKSPRRATSSMFSVRIQEVPLPTTERDIDGLVAWFIESLCLVRKRGEATADLGRAGPVHRLLRDFLFAQPTSSWDAQMLADELALTPASLNHHLSRLVESGLVGYTNEGKGWRRYYLRGGSLHNAIEFFTVQTQTIVRQRLALIENQWDRQPLRMALEVPESDTPPLVLGVVEARPLREDGMTSELSQWMGDFGLLGERPGKEAKASSISVQLFEVLLTRDAPLSLDEAAELIDGPKARLGRILERFRASGTVERVARIDRLSVALWAAMIAQHQRRGEDWMLKKGGFQRLLNTKQQSALLKQLKKGKLTVEDVDGALKQVDATEQMLLLNLLGGRLPMGHRMSGERPQDVAQQVLNRLDRVLRRMRRVSELLEQIEA